MDIQACGAAVNTLTPQDGLACTYSRWSSTSVRVPPFPSDKLSGCTPPPSPQDGLVPHDAHTLALALHLCDDGLQALDDVLV